MKNSSLHLFLVGCLLASCNSTDVERTANGVIVCLDAQAPNQTRKVRIEVMGEKLMHVSATPEKNFSTKKSLVVLPVEVKTDFTVEEREDSVFVSTRHLTAAVSRLSGDVQFRDPDGRSILSEDECGRSFKTIEVEGTKAYTVRQVFQSASDDEGWYGLGQHQSDEFNYKGKNEELFQYNTKVSVPFIVSTRGYGILWDSYSLCRFGHPDAYSQLGQVFRLFDKDGREGALTGTYEPADKQKETLVRREDSLYFEHYDRSTHLKKVVNLPDFPFAGSRVVYEGEIEPKKDGAYHFILYYAGYMKVWLDGQLVVPERWRAAWNPNSYKFTANLKSGKRIPLKIEWLPDGDTSFCGLRVLSLKSAEEEKKMSWWGEMQDQIDYYFVSGNTMDEVISGYRTLTGRSPIMPRWAMGFWQSRERYKTQAELLATLKEFRQRSIPIDNIVLDWFYWPESQWGSHEFDAARFPDPKAMIDSIHQQHAHLMISVWPKFYAGTKHFREFDEQGWMYRQAVKDSIRDWVGPGYVGSFYDAYSPEARQLFWQQIHEHLYPLCIDAWWMDASEPNVADCTDLEYRKQLCGPTALGPSAQYFNTYALMNAKAIYEGQREAAKNRRVFLLTRSGFAGLQRYSTATWSGDIGTRWEDMKAQISAGLNYAVSGIPYWTMDIGGFSVENRYYAAQDEYNHTGKENANLKEWRELLTRWYQFGAFCPLYRAHGQYPYREIWNIAPESHPAYQSILYYSRLRYRLMPYIYSLAGMTWTDDYTIMRPLVMDFTRDKQTYNISDQYMFGPSLMVSPVYEYGARSREIYFPDDCGWYDLYTNKHVDGGQRLTVSAPYDRMPIFVREGSILPVGTDMQYSDEKPASELILYVYTGQDGHFTLYEDEGTTYDYEQGRFSTIPFTYDESKGQFVIGDRQGSFPSMLQNRTFKVILIKPTGTCEENLVNYSGSSVTIPML